MVDDIVSNVEADLLAGLKVEVSQYFRVVCQLEYGENVAVVIERNFEQFGQLLADGRVAGHLVDVLFLEDDIHILQHLIHQVGAVGVAFQCQIDQRHLQGHNILSGKC